MQHVSRLLLRRNSVLISVKLYWRQQHFSSSCTQQLCTSAQEIPLLSSNNAPQQALFDERCRRHAARRMGV
jgi:hypothetical protein